jgi:PAS domain S-box-containing protein
MAETAQAPPSDAQLFRDIFDASPLGIAVENFEGQPLFVNRALCSMLGFSQEEMCTKHCVQFSPPEDAEKDWALLQQLRAGSIDRYQLDKRYFRRDGSLVWGRLSISLLRGRPLSASSRDRRGHHGEKKGRRSPVPTHRHRRFV